MYAELIWTSISVEGPVAQLLEWLNVYMHGALCCHRVKGPGISHRRCKTNFLSFFVSLPWLCSFNSPKYQANLTAASKNFPSFPQIAIVPIGAIQQNVITGFQIVVGLVGQLIRWLMVCILATLESWTRWISRSPDLCHVARAASMFQLTNKS